MIFREEQTFHYQQEMYKAKPPKINLDLRKRLDNAKRRQKAILKMRLNKNYVIYAM